MGFTIVAPDHFLGSGHPDGRDQLPPFLGLIESRDAGRTWRPVSLEGEVDFHVLEASGQRVYGYGSDFETREPRFLASSDGGPRGLDSRSPSRSSPWRSLPTTRASASRPVKRGLFRSDDGGRSWAPVDAPGVGLLAWTSRRSRSLVDLDGRVVGEGRCNGWSMATGGRSRGQPAALDTGPDGELLVALHDGTVKRSADQGRTWDVRSRP